MIAILGIIAALLLAAMFFMARALGRMGQEATPKERMEHSAGEHHTPGPRATGLN